MAKPKIGVQLIIWGKRQSEDLPGVLEEVSSLGFDGVETSLNAYEKIRDPKGLLKKADLTLAGIHLGIDEKMADAALGLLRRMDGRNLLFSGAGGKENSEENYLKSSNLLEKIGKKAADEGVKVCYHNHWQEIVNGAMGTKIICRKTSPEHVSLCIDTYWVKCGGLSPADFIGEHMDRVAYLHLKDGTEEGMKRREFLELGRGAIDFSAVFKVAESKNIEWYVVEQDTTDKTPKDSSGISRRYLKEKFGL